MMLVYYPSKKDMKNFVGRPLNYTETSMFGPEFKNNGKFCVSNRPSITGVKGREFFAEVTMKDGLIAKVS
jgi:hypothetical protein